MQGRETQKQESMELKGTGDVGEQGAEGKQRVSFGLMIRCYSASFLCTRDCSPEACAQQPRRSPSRPVSPEAKMGAGALLVLRWGGQPPSQGFLRTWAGWGGTRLTPLAGGFALPLPYNLPRKGARESILNKFSMGLCCPGFVAYGGVDLAGDGGWRGFLQGAA